MPASPMAPAVIAHRGASAAAPENTIEAFVLAVELGADGIELDVRRTADGHLVVHHDAHVDTRAIIELDRADLPGHIPDLAAALDACEGVWVNLEIKNAPSDPDFDPTRSLAADVVDLLSTLDDDDRWLISSFDLEMIAAVRARSTSIRTGWLVKAIDADVIARTVAGGHQALHPWVERLDQRAVDAAHDAGLGVNAWTCNDEDRMRDLIAWGVDGFCTDVPDVARRLVVRP